MKVPTLSSPEPPQAVPKEAEADRLVDQWSRQLMEHALFLSLGLVSDRGQVLARDASRNRNDWEVFRKGGTAGPQRRAIAIRLSAELASIKSQVLERLEAGEWLGWLFPSFVRHILSELLYFTGTLESLAAGTAREARADVSTWITWMAEHAAFAAHLLDPREVKLIREARAILGALSGIGICGGSMRSLVDLSEKAAQQLDQYLVSSGIGTPKVKSIVHPVLAAHVVREGRMFMDVLGRMRESLPVAIQGRA